MSRVLKSVTWECIGCGHKAKFDNTAVQDRLGYPLTLGTLASVLDEARCTKCHQSGMRAWDKDGRLLIDQAQMMLCGACGLPITLPRLAAQPGVKLCLACAEADEKPVKSAPWPSPPKALRQCPKCGRATVLQYPKSGAPFIGCITFPSCWWRAELSASQEEECFGVGGFEVWRSQHSR